MTERTNSNSSQVAIYLWSTALMNRDSSGISISSESPFKAIIGDSSIENSKNEVGRIAMHKSINLSKYSSLIVSACPCTWLPV